MADCVNSKRIEGQIKEAQEKAEQKRAEVRKQPGKLSWSCSDGLLSWQIVQFQSQIQQQAAASA
jgi:hypothetical protein